MRAECRTPPRIITNATKAAIIEDYVNNPNQSLNCIAFKHGVGQETVSAYLAKLYFNTIRGEKVGIVLKSAV